MNITINTEQPVSDMDRAILLTLLEIGDRGPATAATEAPAPKPKKAESAKVAEKILAANAEPGTVVDESGPTLADAVQAATGLISTGKSDTVKAALASVGAKRVGEIDESQIEAFLAALEA